GFRSRRGLNYDDSAPVTPHNAPFPTYKTNCVFQHSPSLPVFAAITRKASRWWHCLNSVLGGQRTPSATASKRQKRWPRRCWGAARRRHRSTRSSALRQTACAPRHGPPTSGVSAASGWDRCMGCRSRSRTTSIRPIFRPPAERPRSRRIARNATHRSCSTCSMPAPSCSAKPICKSSPMVRPTTTRRLVRRATRTIPRASRAARAVVAPPLSQRASRRPPWGRIPAGPRPAPPPLSRVMHLRPTPPPWRRSQAGISPLSHTRDTAGPMARDVADCVLLDGVITGGPTEVTPAPLKGLRLGLPRDYFWENLDAELAAILEAALARLRE